MGLLAAVAALLLSLALLDRPLATWTHAQFHGVALFRELTWIVDPIAPLASLALLCAGVAALAGWRPGPMALALLGAAMATLLAAALKDELKLAFGRTWPETWTDNNPSYIHDGVFAFVWFHGGKGWTSFPSGHTTMMTAPLASLWRAMPAVRWPGLTLTALVVIGLLGADYHWLSDVIGGGLLGTAVGSGVAALFRRPGSPQSGSEVSRRS